MGEPSDLCRSEARELLRSRTHAEGTQARRRASHRASSGFGQEAQSRGGGQTAVATRGSARAARAVSMARLLHAERAREPPATHACAPPARHRSLRVRDRRLPWLRRPRRRALRAPLQRLPHGFELLLLAADAGALVRRRGSHAVLRSRAGGVRRAHSREPEARRPRAHETPVPQGHGRRAARRRECPQGQARALGAAEELAAARRRARPTRARVAARR